MSILGLFKRKPEPLIIRDELGTFILEHPQTDDCYEGAVRWPAGEALVSLDVDSEETLTADIALGYLRRIAAESAQWDERIRAYAAEDLSNGDENIETWENDGASYLTKEAFIRRISIGFIHIHTDGNLFFYYDLDGMFTDHGLGVYADISGEILSSEICG